MTKQFKDLQAATEHLTFTTEAGLDVFLRKAFPKCRKEATL